jgi:hypothetical protein
MIDEDDFWSNWWNEIWQGKPKYSEKTYPSATLSTTMDTLREERLFLVASLEDICGCRRKEFTAFVCCLYRVSI